MRSLFVRVAKRVFIGGRAELIGWAVCEKAQLSVRSLVPISGLESRRVSTCSFTMPSRRGFQMERLFYRLCSGFISWVEPD